MNYTVALSGSIGGPFSLFGEFYGNLATDSNSLSSRTFQAGTTILLSRRFQLDLRGGFGKVGDDRGRLAGLGLAYRWPR